MWKLIKSELRYNAFLMWMIFFLPLLFVAAFQYILKPLTGINILEKNIGTILVAMGAYIFIFIIWQQQRSELRTRVFSTLPVTAKQISFSRLVFFIISFLPAVVLIIIVSVLFGHIFGRQLNTISKLLGNLFAVLSFIQLIVDLWFTSTKGERSKKFLMVSSIGFMIIVTSVFCIYDILLPLYGRIFLSGEGVIFFLWGLIILSFSTIIFLKRKSYLE